MNHQLNLYCRVDMAGSLGWYAQISSVCWSGHRHVDAWWWSLSLLL